MVRKVMLALALLLVTVVPAHALERQVRDWRGQFEHDRFHRFERFHSTNPYAYVHTPQCYWQPAYWMNQVIPNAYGGYAYVPQFVPGQWICS
jgi:hypothetical protein